MGGTDKRNISPLDIRLQKEDANSIGILKNQIIQERLNKCEQFPNCFKTLQQQRSSSTLHCCIVSAIQSGACVGMFDLKNELVFSKT